MKVLLGISNRHIHLKEEDFKVLFPNQKMEKVRDLVQPEQFVSDLFVDIKTDKDILKEVRVLGPLRDYTQVEISKTDSYKLGINPPIRESGDLDGASTVTIITPYNEITKECAIIANRHIHITKDLREKYNLYQKTVKIRVPGEKAAILENVHLKETEKAALELHLDTDDANALNLNNKDMIEIIVD